MSERLPLSHCTQCDAELDGGYDSSGEGSVPKEADISVCINCGNVMVYRADQTLRKMTAKEWATLEPDDRRQIERAQAVAEKLERK